MLGPMLSRRRSAAVRGVLRIRWIVVLAAVLLGAVAVSAALLFPRWIETELAARGFDNSRLRAHLSGPTQLVIENLSLGTPPVLSATRITVDFSFAASLHRRAETVTVEGLELNFRYAEGQLEWSALKALFTSDASILAPESRPSLPGFPRFLPFESLQLTAPRVSIKTTNGQWHARLSLNVRPGGIGNYRLEMPAFVGPGELRPLEVDPISVNGAFHLLGEEPHLTASISTIRVHAVRSDDSPQLLIEGSDWRLSGTPSAGGPLRVSGQIPDVNLLAQGIAGKDLDIRFAFPPDFDFPTGQLKLGSWRDQRVPARFPAFSLAGQLKPAQRAVDLDIQALSQSERFSAQVQLTPDFESSELRFRLFPMHLDQQLPHPSALFPDLVPAITQLSGQVFAEGQLRWPAGGPSFSSKIHLQNLGATSPLGSLDCVNGVMGIQGPQPWVTPPDQSLSIGSLRMGLPLTEGQILYRLEPGEKLVLERASWDLAGGSIEARGSLALSATEQSLRLRAKDIDLSRLFPLLGVPGLTGTGFLEGELPLVRANSQIRVQNGRLAATQAGGWIRYQPSGQSSALPESGSLELADLERALQNFRYSKFSMQLNGALHGSVRIEINLEGSNPTYRDGQPYVLNLSVEGDLAALIAQETSLYRLPGRLEKDVAQTFGADPGAPTHAFQVACPLPETPGSTPGLPEDTLGVPPERIGE